MPGSNQPEQQCIPAYTRMALHHTNPLAILATLNPIPRNSREGRSSGVSKEQHGSRALRESPLAQKDCCRRLPFIQLLKDRQFSHLAVFSSTGTVAPSLPRKRRAESSGCGGQGGNQAAERRDWRKGDVLGAPTETEGRGWPQNDVTAKTTHQRKRIARGLFGEGPPILELHFPIASRTSPGRFPEAKRQQGLCFWSALFRSLSFQDFSRVSA